MKRWLCDLRWIVPISLCVGIGMGMMDGGSWWIGMLAYGLILFISLSILVTTWRWAEAKRSLALLLLLAFALRLGMGVALTYMLPESGYTNDPFQAGYLFADSYDRDIQAWDLASSDLSLSMAFDKEYSIDQYGGLMAFSAFVYRFLSPDLHRPWLIILLAASFYTLGLVFLWQSVRIFINQKAALVAGLFFALYPETLFLGSAQMREPFLITFMAIAFWGAVDWQERRQYNAWIWLGCGLSGMLLFSPAVALFGLLVLAGWFIFQRKDKRFSWIILLILCIVFILSLLLFSFALERIETLPGDTLFERIYQWFRYSYLWDVYQLARSSHQIESLFIEIPNYLHLPLVTVYGILQPVLPAALVEPAPWLVQSISVLRALGWYILAPVFIYALVGILRDREFQQRSLLIWLFATQTIWLVISAIRAGGDQWDNPRYRAIFIIWQVLLAGYALTRKREKREPWLFCICGMEMVFLIFFTAWYITRYSADSTGQLPFWGMVIWILALSTLVLLGSLAYDFLQRRKRQH